MALPSRASLLRLVGVFLDKKRKVERAADETPLELAEDYSAWFRSDFIAWLSANLTVDKGRWQPNDPTVITRAGQQALQGVTAAILNPVGEWITQQYPEFWLAGLDMWRVNLEMIGEPAPRKLKLTPSEIEQIAVLATGEIATQSDHAQRHRRYVERMVQAGMSMGWTMERFIQAATAPDGGIVGYPIGNSRYSWRYHMGLLVTGRSKAIAAAAQEYRFSREAGNG